MESLAKGQKVSIIGQLLCDERILLGSVTFNKRNFKSPTAIRLKRVVYFVVLKLTLEKWRFL